MVKVSVIIATYNRSTQVVRAIGSVLSQDFTAIEVLVVDDGSTDDTLERIGHLYDDQRLQVIRRPHRGAASAMNTGLKKAIGEYIMFLGSDDMMLPGCISELYHFITQRSLDFAWAGFQEISAETEELLGYNNYFPDTTTKMFAYFDIAYIGSGIGLIIDERLFNSIGVFDESLTIAIDCDWMIRLGVMRYPKINCGYLERNLMKIRMGAKDQISAQVGSRARAFDFIYNKHLKVYQANPRIHARLRYAQAAYYYMGYQGNEAKAAILTALKLNPMGGINYYFLFLKILVLGILGKSAVHNWRRRKT